MFFHKGIHLSATPCTLVGIQGYYTMSWQISGPQVGLDLWAMCMQAITHIDYKWCTSFSNDVRNQADKLLNRWANKPISLWDQWQQIADILKILGKVLVNIWVRYMTDDKAQPNDK